MFDEKTGVQKSCETVPWKINNSVDSALQDITQYTQVVQSPTGKDFKGIIQRKLRWVEIGINRRVLL